MNAGSGGLNSRDPSCASAAAMAAAAAAHAAPSPPSRPLRAAAEALAAELVRITALADACSPRGVLEALALAAAAGVHGGKGEEERVTEFSAAIGRVRVIVGRLEDDSGEVVRAGREVTPGDVEIDTDGSRRAAPAHGGRSSSKTHSSASLNRNSRSSPEDGGVHSSVELFRKEFVARTKEAGGLRALALSWNGVARLEEAFLAWVGEVGLLGRYCVAFECLGPEKKNRRVPKPVSYKFGSKAA